MTPTRSQTLGAPPVHEGHARTAAGYLEELAQQAARISVHDLADFTGLVVETLVAGRTVFVVGNGGSASTAGHIACDWLNACARAGIRARITSLADSVSTMTALANDTAYDEVFARQLDLQGAPGDLLVLLSVSGDSANLLAAAQRARQRGMRIAGLLGNEGAVTPYCDSLVVCGGGDYGLAEDLHLVVNHIVVRALGGGAALRYPRPEPGR